jgi:hypothetical protein
LNQRRIRAFGITALLFFFGFVQAQAALQFDVFLGYDGLVPEASWFPVVCEIKNDGPPFNAIVEVAPGDYGQGQTRRLPVPLPTGTLKRVVLPVFCGSKGYVSWDVRLLDERGKTRAEQVALRPRKQVNAGIPLIGALSRTPNGAPMVRPGAGGDSQPGTARLLPVILPDNPLVLEGMTTLYLNSERAVELRAPDQVDAIYAWLNQGGHLIIGVEQPGDINSTAWLRNLCPVDLKDMRGIKPHPELQDWIKSANYATNSVPVSTPYQANQFKTQRSGGRLTVVTPQNTGTPPPLVEEMADDLSFETAELQVATGALKQGSKADVSVEGTPLIVSAPRGRGTVTVLLFNPEREPMRSWKNLETFWTKAANVPAAAYSNAQNPYAGMSTDGIFGAMIDSRQVHKLPIGWLLVLLLIYLVVIGPLDQYWLKKIGKPMLTWITFPCYVVAFSLLIYVIGYHLRAGESEWNELHVVDVLPNGDRAELRGHSFISIYAPANQKYLLESDQKFSTLRGEFAGFWGGGQTTEKANIIQIGDSFKAEVFVPVWTTQPFVNDWWAGADMPFTVTMNDSGDSWLVDIDNHLSERLSSVQIVSDGEVSVIGEIGSNQKKTFRIAKGGGRPLKQFVTDHASRFQQAVSDRQRAFGSTEAGRIDDMTNGVVAASFISQADGPQNNMGRFVAPPGIDLSKCAEDGQAIVFACVNDFSPIAPLYKSHFKRSHKSTMFRLAVPKNKPSTVKLGTSAALALNEQTRFK